MVKVVEFDLESRQVRDMPPGFVALDRTRDDVVYWIHLDSTDPAALEALIDELDIGDPLAGDLREDMPAGRATERDESISLSLAWCEPSAERPQLAPFRVHLTGKFCLSICGENLPCVTSLAATCRRDIRFARSSGFILFLLLDSLVDDLVERLAPIDDRAEWIFDRIYEQFDAGLNQHILSLKRSVLGFRRAANAARDVLMRVSGRKHPVITDPCRESLVEVYHHAQALVSSLDSRREVVSGLLDSYMSVVSQDTNRAMKILTVFASVILPMTLIAGIYGMNFKRMPELEMSNGYFAVLGVMALTGIMTLTVFKLRKWI